MPNPFSLNVITSAGANLIAQATAANPIVFVDALSGTNAASSNADLASKDASFYNGITGTIQASSATNNVAKIVVRFGNAGENPQAVKSVCLRGRLANQNDSQAVIVSAMSDANSEIVIPSDLSPNQIIRIPFLFAVNTDGIVQTVYADGATMADLERFVSLHKAGNSQEGDNQTIKGNKTFDGYTTFNGGVLFDSYVQCEGNLAVTGDFLADDAEINSLLVSTGIKPNGSVVNIGGTNYDRFNYVFTSSINLLNHIVPASGNSGSIGQSYQRFNNAYINYIDTTKITIPYGSDSFDIQVENGQFSVNTGIFPKGSFDLGTVSNMWRTLYALEIDLDPTNTVKLYEDDGDLILQPKVNGSVYIGTSTNTRGDLYAKNLHGCLETLYDPNLGVGSLAEIELYNTTQSQPVSVGRSTLVYAGFVISGQTLSVTLDGQSITGRWRVLNSVTVGTTQGVSYKVMAVRVE